MLSDTDKENWHVCGVYNTYYRTHHIANCVAFRYDEAIQCPSLTKGCIEVLRLRDRVVADQCLKECQQSIQ